MSKVRCPRCGFRFFTPHPETAGPKDPPYPALSRFDNETYICSFCGQDEAMRDMAGAERLGPDDWPLGLRAFQELNG